MHWRASEPAEEIRDNENDISNTDDDDIGNADGSKSRDEDMRQLQQWWS